MYVRSGGCTVQCSDHILSWTNERQDAENIRGWAAVRPLSVCGGASLFCFVPRICPVLSGSKPLFFALDACVLVFCVSEEFRVAPNVSMFQATFCCCVVSAFYTCFECIAHATCCVLGLRSEFFVSFC